jgi:hypothetical protein
MQNKVIVLMIACIGTMLYCSDFLISRKASKRKVSQETLFKRVEVVLRRMVNLAQKVAYVQSVILDTTTSIVNGSLKQEVRGQLVQTIDHVESILSKCEHELNGFADFLRTRVLYQDQEENDTK